MSSKVLDKIFPPFVDSKREKPRDMLYVAHEKPPMGLALIAAGQQALVVLMLVVYAVIAGREVGMSEAMLQGFVAMGIIVMGVATLLQGMPTRFSSGHLIVHNPSTISIATFIVVSTSFGIEAAAGAYLLSGVIIIILSRFLPKLQTVFPPEVTGILLLLLGLTLVEGGITRFTGLDEGAVSLPSVVIAMGTLGTIVAVSVWTSSKVRVFAVGLGMIVGLSLAVGTGVFGSEQMNTVTSQSIFAFPLGAYSLPSPSLVIAAAIPIVVIEIIGAVDSIGTGVAIDKMNNKKWKRPDLPMISRLVTTHGIGVFLNGLTGTLACGTSSANLGLAHATGVAARSVAVLTGTFLIAAAFLPSVSTFIVLIPTPVMGAIVVYTAGYMFVAGMQLILSRMINTRRTFLVGLSITAGASIILMPELTASLPENLKPILGSGLTVGVLMAIVLNMLFRIGVAQSSKIKLTGYHSGPQAAKFLEDCGMDWGARPDVIARAGIAVGEALEALNAAGLADGVPTLRAKFDEYKLTLWLTYSGKAIILSKGGSIDLKTLMEDEDDNNDAALDTAMSSMSGILIQNLADQVSSKENKGQAELFLQFVH